MLNKTIFSFCLILFSLSSIRAQVEIYPVSVITQLAPPYSVNLPDYAAPGCEQLKVIIVQRDLTQAPYMLYLKMQIELNGRVIIRSASEYSPPALILEPGIPTVISGTDLTPFFDPQNMEFAGYSRDAYMRSKVLPEGSYTITFTAYDWTRRDVALSRGGSFFCYLAKAEPPVLNLPVNNAIVPVTSSQYINFQWLSRTSSSPNSAFSTKYQFELFEMRVGGIHPSEIVQTTRPLFATETDRSNLSYSIGYPVLEEGMRYAWRVRAFDTQGKDYIRNNGYSEVFNFIYGGTGIALNEIENFTAQALSPRKARLTWDASPGYDCYKIFYRRQGSNNKWYESETVLNNAEVNSLNPGVIYECRVQGKSKNTWGGFSRTDTVLLPYPPLIECGSSYQQLAVSNREPLLELMKLEQFDAGGFMVTVIDPYAITTKPGRFTGRGFVQVPLFGHKKIRCEFADIFINTDYQMVEGRIRMITDNTQGGDNAIWDVDEVFEGGADNGSVIEGTEEVALIIPDVIITKPESIILDTARREIIIVNESNDSVRIDINPTLQDNSANFTVQDSEGNLYSIDTKTGKATSLGKVPPSGGNQQLAALPSIIDARKGTVFFELVPGETRFAFDKRDAGYSRANLFNEEYKTIKTSDGSLYDVPFKLIPVGETDIVMARAEIKSRTVDADSIVFRSGTGTTYKTKQTGKKGQYLLTLPSGRENDGIEIYATWTDSKGHSYVLGKLIVLSYSVKRPKLTLVPVGENGTDIDPAIVKEDLDRIYHPVAVDWQVSMDMSGFRAEGGELDVTGSGLFSQYTDGMKKLNNEFVMYKKESFDPSTIYLFLLPESEDGNTTGDMPRSKQFGYIFTRTAEAGGKDALYRTIAHEIAHGAFSLKHTFDSQYQLQRGSTDNLLDYTAGTELVKHQWDAIHDPGLVIGMFERDEDGMAIGDAIALIKGVDYAYLKRCNTSTSANEIFSNTVESYKYIGKNSSAYIEGSVQISILQKTYPLLLHANPEEAILIFSNGTLIGICDPQNDYSGFCTQSDAVTNLNFLEKLESDVEKCRRDNALKILQELQTSSYHGQSFELSIGGKIYTLGSGILKEVNTSVADINSGNWSDGNIDMIMRIGYDIDGILQFTAIGIRKDLSISMGKTAILNGIDGISHNMLAKNNALLKEYKVDNINITLASRGANLDSDEFPDSMKVEINKEASFIRILCEAGNIGLRFLKTAEIEQPVYLEGQDNSIKAPPICTGSLEGGAMAVTDITSIVTTIHDLITDKQARKNAVEGLKSIKNQVEDKPSLLFPILGEIVLQELSGNDADDFKEMAVEETNSGRRGHLITKTSVRTTASILASGKFLARLPDMAVALAAKMPKAKVWLRFRSIDDALSANLLNRLKSLPDGGNKFLDDFATSSDEELGKFLKNPELIDAWEKMDDFKAEDALRKNLGALDALSKPKFDRPDPKTYLNPKYIDDHLKKFEGGVTKFISDVPTGAIGPPSGTFVIPKSQADELIKQAGGDVYKLEDLLGLDKGVLGSKPMRIDVDVPSGLRMSRGNEVGANNNWIPGGRTSKGILEATVDQIQQGTFITKFVFNN